MLFGTLSRARCTFHRLGSLAFGARVLRVLSGQLTESR
jgi:hypothetical protein